MLESQRRELMEAMGVKILHPRFVFVAAKTSPVLLAQVANDSDLTLDYSSRTSSDKPAIISASPDSLAVVTTNANITTAATTSPTSSKIDVDLSGGKKPLDPNKTILPFGETTKATSIKFRHRLVRVGELMMLIDQPTLEWHEEKQARQFFSDIYFALTNKKFEYWFESQFDWPPAKQFPHANDVVMARQALQSFMLEQMQPSCKYIILWGNKLAANLFEQVPNVGEVEFLAELPVLIVDSYQEYWQNPSKKYLLWQHLQSVRKRLFTNG